MTKKTIRDSGIELLKIIALFLIVISHVVQTLRSENPYVPYHDFIVNLSVASTDIRNFILTLFSYFGVLGNSCFFISSSWFLLRSSKYNPRKWFYILFDVWFISIIILAVTLLVRNGNIPGKLIIKSCFPTTFSNNWYLTCYLLFYPMHLILNSIIHIMDKKQLLRVSVALFFLYSVFNFIWWGLFFASLIILWVAVYFVIAYLQLYMVDFTNCIKCNIILLLLGVAGYIGIALAANILGLHITFFYNKVLHWATNCNPFLIAISIALFNLMRRLTFKNKIINYVSSLSLLIYIIHENIILRFYYRPAMWEYIYRNYGYDKLILWVLVLSFLVFVFGAVTAVIYDKIIRRMMQKPVDSIYSLIKNLYLKLESEILKFH